MGMIASYADLYTYVIMDVPGISTPVMLQYLQQAGRDFARSAKGFRGPLDPQPLVNYQEDYDLLAATSHDVSITRLESVRMNGVPQSLEYCELFESRWLRLHDPIVPADEDEERLLVCGATPKTAYTDWQAVTAGYYTITVNTSTYEAGPCDFSAVASMDDVARVLQTAWRAAQEYNRNYVKWADAGTNKLLFWTDSGEINVLTAGTSGTDISGAAYINGLTGAGAVYPVLEVDAALMPDMRTDTFPDWFLDRYGMIIAAKAVHEMTKLRGSVAHPNPWYNPELSQQRLYDYQRGLSEARISNRVGDRNVLEPIL